jgi:RNA polymerase sigma factor for flagellar operon FliA
MEPKGPHVPPGDAQGLWNDFKDQRSQETRNRLLDHYLPLSRKIAKILYARRGGLEVEFADYLQQATQGLIEAIDRFDPTRGVAFETYATVRIRGAVLNSLPAMSEKYAQINLRKRLRRERVDSLTEPMQEPGTRARDSFLELAELAIGLAISYMLEGTGMVGAETSSWAGGRDAYSSMEQRQLADSLRRLVEALPQRERTVVQSHYYQGLSFTEVAETLGVTKGRVSQIHRQALQLIREAQAAEGRLDLSG